MCILSQNEKGMDFIMNQIIYIKEDNEKSNNKKFVFKAQFIFSIILIFILLTIYLYFRYNNQIYSENSAYRISNNYHVYRLYANETNNESAISSSVIGTIQIPEINVSYPILSDLNETLLKASPCKFLGDISDDSNLCIAGHNYDNDKFFSRINLLTYGDKIIITDNNNVIYNFSVFDNYEVDASDLSPIYKVTNRYKKELTLVTCNNQNNKRIIVKAKLET